MDKIINLIKDDTRKLLNELKNPNLVKILKFYEILKEIQEKNIKKNKREIFYQSVNIFKCQKCVDDLVTRTSNLFCVTRNDLLIKSSLKGLIYGKIAFSIEDKIIEDCLLIPDMMEVKNIYTSAKIAIVVEKDSLFSLICQQLSFSKILRDVIFICGKGYPCNNTINLLKRIENFVTILGMFDYDPFGLHIYTIYKYGSKKNPICINGMKRIGMNCSDIFKYKIDEKDLIKLNCRDYRMIKTLKKYKEDLELQEDLNFLIGLDRKMEMEIFTGRNSNWIMDYIEDKIKYI